jgi:FlgD Ig-like domain
VNRNAEAPPIGDTARSSRDAKNATRRLGVAILSLAALVLGASVAAANDITAKITCSGVTFEGANFPDATGNTVNETVSVDGVQVAATTLTFDGESGSNTITLNLSPGAHTIAAHADWNTNGVSGTFDASQDVSCGTPPQCTVIGSINSGFNGTAIVGVGSGPAFIWFNSNLSVKGMTAGKSIFLTNATVSINGVPHAVPDAKITFSAVSCASTSFDAGTNTWNTSVPLAGSDEIFLSGLAFPVSNLPGGAKVTWEGTFGTDQPGICLSWKWGAAAYTNFTTVSTSPLVIDYNAANIKPTHQAACAINNGDHAGTPQNPTVRASVTGGARGGGGSNFTGSWSGTGSVCPVCPPTTAGAKDAASVVTRGPATGFTAPTELSFATPRPNPTTGPNTLLFALPREAAISLRAYDVTGRLVRELASGTYSAGAHTLSWDLTDRDGRPVAGGIYFLRLAVEGRVLRQNLSVAR